MPIDDILIGAGVFARQCITQANVVCMPVEMNCGKLVVWGV